MKRFHANVGARNTALEKAPEVLNPISMNLAIYVLLRMVDDFMCVLILQRFVGIVFVAVKKRVKSDVFVNVFSQGRGLTIGDDLGAYVLRVQPFQARWSWHRFRAPDLRGGAP